MTAKVSALGLMYTVFFSPILFQPGSVFNCCLLNPVVISDIERLTEGNNMGTIPGYNADSVRDPVGSTVQCTVHIFSFS